MTQTPPLCASSSWVDLSNEISSGAVQLSYSASGVFNLHHETSGGVFIPISPCRTTPVPFGSDQDYMRMLKEAQKETSCRSSARVSPLTSAFVSSRSSPCLSPKSPPNSPRTETADFSSEFRDVFINKMKESENCMTDFMWDWSSTPCAPKELKTQTTKNRSKTKKSGRSSFSTFYTFLISNLVSLLLGVGLGAWIYNRSTTQLRVDL